MSYSKRFSLDDPVINSLIERYFQGNEAARTFLEVSDRQGWPLIIDHIAFRCLNIDERAGKFLGAGYLFKNETVAYSDQGWWAKVYRKQGLPALFVDQAYDDARGNLSIIPKWVKRFGDENLHHAAVLVDDIEQRISLLERAGVEFSGSIVGNPGSRLRQIFSASEIRDGAAYTVLELTERNDYSGFYPDQANRLMQSSTKTKSA